MKQEILKWIEEFVEQPNPKLGNWAPCPYARAARINNQIKIIEGTVPSADIDVLLSHEWEHEVYVYWYPTDEYSAELFQSMVKKLNKKLMPRDIVILEDHPKLIEHVNDVCMNFGKAALMIVQKLSSLNDAADKLERQGYYQHWTQEELDEVKTWRYDR